MKELISVIVPVYNVEKYLKKCIDSITNQTYKNLEIILIDDGSTDNSISILNEYFKIDRRIKIIHKKNGGQSSAKNLGIEIAAGEYIAFVDSDDWIDTDMYFELWKEMEKGYDLAVCGRKVFDERDNLINEVKVEEEEIDLSEMGLENYFLNSFLYPHTVSGVNRIYKKEVIDKLNLRFEDIKVVGTEDTLFNYIYISNIKKIKGLNKMYYNQTSRENSTMGIYNPGYMKRLGNLMEELEKNENKKILPVIFLYFLQFYSKLIKNYKKDKIDLIFQELKEGSSKKYFLLNLKRLLSKETSNLLIKKGYSRKGVIFIKIIAILIIRKNYRLVGKLI